MDFSSFYSTHFLSFFPMRHLSVLLGEKSAQPPRFVKKYGRFSQNLNSLHHWLSIFLLLFLLLFLSSIYLFVEHHTSSKNIWRLWNTLRTMKKLLIVAASYLFSTDYNLLPVQKTTPMSTFVNVTMLLFVNILPKPSFLPTELVLPWDIKKRPPIPFSGFFPSLLPSFSLSSSLFFP
jgi:hypothetical protein